jgi:3-methyladenine DNA glycosylase AlkD
VDASAHHIVGAHLFDEKKDLLLSLARSDVMWERRIAMVSTWYFIKHDLLDWTVTLAEILLHDTQDLMHKAVGWMLREMGKRDVKVLQCFLEKHVRHMPRTMLRYAIEKFSDPERKRYLSLK